MGLALLWIGLLGAGAGWVMLLFFVGVDVPGFRSVEEVVNVHKVGVALGIVLSGFGLAILGGVAMVFERVNERQSSALGRSRRPLGIRFVSTDKGASIQSVRDGSPAQLADLRESDTIVLANGVSFAGLSQEDMTEILRSEVEKLELIVLREDRELTITVPVH